MNKDLQYYQQWILKWTKILKSLYNKQQNKKAYILTQKVKEHIWLIEWRLLCVKWFDDKADESNMFPKVLRYSKTK
jgi:hypothetical protein